MSEHNGTDGYDFVLKGARVIDPYNKIDGMLDLAVSNNKIAGIGKNLGSAKEIHDVTGKIVVPGMIDTHAHVFEYVSGRFGLNPDMVGVQSGVVTLIDQGGPSCMTFPGFRKFIVEPAQSRVLAFLSIYTVGGLEGHYYPYLYGPGGIDVEGCARAALANKDLVKGLKAHAEGGGISRWGLETLKLAKEAGKASELPIYVHLGELWPPEGEINPDMDDYLPEIVNLLEEGDILAHPFTRHPGGFVNKNGDVHPIIWEALNKGVLIDIGHGSHFSFDMAEKVINAGILPHTLGADMHGYNTSVPKPQGSPDEHPDDEMHLFAGDTRFSLCSAMTELMAMGVSLEKIIPMVTSNCSKMLGMNGELGTLSIGSSADISVLEIVKGKHKIADNSGVSVTVEERIKPNSCYVAGQHHVANSPLLPI